MLLNWKRTVFNYVQKYSINAKLKFMLNKILYLDFNYFKCSILGDLKI